MKLPLIHTDAPPLVPLNIEQARQQERHRIAREIHDVLGGNLIGIKMALAQLTRRLPDNDPVLAEHAAYLQTLVERTIEAAQHIAQDQKPDGLKDGIVAALAWHSREFERQLGYPCQFSSNPQVIDLTLDHSVALFRIYQEALTNIAKHANASRVVARLLRTRHGISLKISDNGRGISASDQLKPASLGLISMQERAHDLGGNLSIRSRATGGSVLTIKFPLGTPHN